MSLLTILDRKPVFPRKGLVSAWEPFRQVNVLRQSVNLADTGVWTRTGLHATEGVTLVPGGGPGGRDAWRVKEDGTAASYHKLTGSVASVVGSTYVTTLAVKASERSWIRFTAQNLAGAWVNFNAATGQFGDVGASTSGCAVKSLGDGWWQVWFVWVSGATTHGSLEVYLMNAASTTLYDGDNTSSLLITEPQLEQALPGQTTPSAYVPTDALQLLNQSPRWKRGAWQAKRGSTDGVDTNDFAVESRRWVFDGIDNYADLQTEDFGGACSLFAGPGEAWTVAVVASAADGVAGVLVARASSDTTKTFQLYKLNPSNKMFVHLRGGVLNEVTPVAIDALSHLHVITWDGASAKYYRDGGGPITLNVGEAAEEVGQRVILGARTNGTGVFLNGSIPAFYFWSRALSPSEVARLRLRYLKPELASVGVTIP